MKYFPARFIFILCFIHVFNACASVLYVDVGGDNATPPYSDWNTAATNIQNAIDASTDGDLILVTNGVYQTGGKVMAGNLTNRVALDKAITVQSVNGARWTIIQGAGATNGTVAVRCAWLTNGASLLGFTLTRGATRSSGDTFALQSGGGAWCASSNALVGNCLIVSNTASFFGGGVYQGTVNSSLISSNGAGNISGGASYKSVLNNCTIVSNSIYGAALPWTMTNCIIYYNGFQNYQVSGTAFSHCCTTPALAGTGNFTNAPQLFVDGIHLAASSPCIAAGVNPVTGTDIFGNAWSNPPSVGCAEWTPTPMVTTPQIKLSGEPVGFSIGNVAIGGATPYSLGWLKNGSPLQDNGHYSSTQNTNLLVSGVILGDAGNYQLVVSNAYGVVTSAVAQVVIHCVDASGSNPVAPYGNWSTAATNIQDAITAAVANEIILVTNGLYVSGGKSMDGVITNRVSVDKAVLVQSVNGPNATFIQGLFDPASINGPAAIRCAWMTNNSILSGFTLSAGATRAVSNPVNQTMIGGGVFGTSTNAMICNSVIATNYASYNGGGAYFVTVIGCALTGNHAVGSGTPGSGVAGAGSGGGAESCVLKNCLLAYNFADQSSGGGAENSKLKNCVLVKNSSYLNGGAASGGSLVNCTVTANTSSGYSSSYGGAVYGATLTNCIVSGNFSRTSYPNTNYNGGTLTYCCADPLPAGIGNIANNPQILPDGIHLAASSPCIRAGLAGVVSGTDIDGQPWSNPPAMGCDEWQPAPVIGSQPSFQIGSPAHGLTFTAVVAGQTPFTYFWSKDGLPIQEDGHHSNSGTASLVVNNFGPEDAGLYQVVATNSSGAATSAVVQVVIHAVDAAGTSPMIPFISWASAATTIQDAINVSAAGDIVLVTNGLYATGGITMAGDLTNRVALNKAVTVMSVNGYQATIIQGAWDPVATNGPGAVRCAWLTDGAVLTGFTLQNGATRATGDGYAGGPLQSGGGVWCISVNGMVFNCLLTNNSAAYGGGIAYGTLNNSLVIGNYVTQNGGGAYYVTLNNCTVGNNIAVTSNYSGAGTYGGYVRNSIVIGNYRLGPSGIQMPDDYYIGAVLPRYAHSCASPVGLLLGAGNIDVNPLFLDLFHISSVSACRSAGSALYASGTDLDGEPWANPPSMGCDEVVLSNLVGALSVNLKSYQTNLLVTRSGGFTGLITGQASRVEWSFGDGPIITNSGAGVSHQWINPGDYTVTFTAYNNDNPAGVSTSTIVHVDPLNMPQLQSTVLLTNGFQFQFTGQTNANYIIQYATNLVPPVTWQTLQTIYFNNQSLIQVVDAAGTNQARFYRVLAQ